VSGARTSHQPERTSDRVYDRISDRLLTRLNHECEFSHPTPGCMLKLVPDSGVVPIGELGYEPRDLSAIRKYGSNLRLRLQGLPASCFVGRIGAIRAFTYNNGFVQQSPSENARSRTAFFRLRFRARSAWRSSTSAPLLQGSLRDLYFNGRLAFGRDYSVSRPARSLVETRLL